MRRFSTLIFGVALLGGVPFWTAQAQTSGRATLVGTAHDAAGQPVALATFLLVAATDSTRVLQGVTGDLGGHYTFEGVGPGTYRVRAQQLGYRSATSAPLTVAAGPRELTVPPLVLQATPHKLAEVTITAERPFIEQPHALDRGHLGGQN